MENENGAQFCSAFIKFCQYECIIQQGTRSFGYFCVAGLDAMANMGMDDQMEMDEVGKDVKITVRPRFA